MLLHTNIAIISAATNTMNTDTFETLHIYNAAHYLLKVKVGDLIHTPVQNWEHNRPPDIERCNEIVQHILQQYNSCMDWMFYFIYDTNAQTYKIIDGIHRYTALKMLASSQDPTINADIMEKPILISLRINPTLGETIDLYQNINKSIPLPEIYFNCITTNNMLNRRTVLEESSSRWMKMYPAHFTHCNRPNLPNSNRDQLVDLLDKIYDNLELKTHECMMEKLNVANLHIKNNHLTMNLKLGLSKAIDKCMKTGCWLHLIKNEVLLQNIFI